MGGVSFTGTHRFDVGTHTVVVYAENECCEHPGVKTGSFTVVVNDDEAPELIDLAVACNTLDDTGIDMCLAEAEGWDGQEIVANVRDLYQDNCTSTANLSVTLVDTNSGSISPNSDCGWEFVYTFRIEDEADNFVECDVTRSGSDQTPPSLAGCTLAELNATHECNGEAGNKAEANAWDAANIDRLETCATDNCGGTVTVTSDYDFDDLSDGCGYTGVLTVTYTVKDECQNTTTVTGVFTIVDTTDPYWTTAPVDETVECDGAGNITARDAWLAAPEGDDVCGSAEMTTDYDEANSWTQECGGTGYYTVTFFLTDECGNQISSTKTFTIEDTTAPEITLITDQLRYVDSGQCVYQIQGAEFDPDITDNCGLGTVTVVLTGATVGTYTPTQTPRSTISLDGVVLNSGLTTITWIASDACDIVSEESFTVLVRPTALSGTVSYHRWLSDDEPLEGFTVSLLDEDYQVLISSLTLADGSYTFTDQDAIVAAEYIEVYSPLAHGGIGAVDALAILQNSVPPAHPAYNPKIFIDNVGNVWKGIDPYDPTGFVGLPHNAVDARYVLQRRVGIINSFDAGDWAFYAEDLDENFNNYIGNPYEGGVLTTHKARLAYNLEFCELDILVRAYGDVVGNISLPTVTKTSWPVQSNKVLVVEQGALFSLPLTFTKEATFYASAVDLLYDQSLVEIIGLESSLPQVELHINEEAVSIAWAGLSSHIAAPGDTLVLLTMRTLAPVRASDVVFMLGGDTGFTHKDLLPIPDVELSIAGITTGEDDVVGIVAPDSGGISLDAFPNPFRNELNLVFDLPALSDVQITIMNAQGARVAEISKQAYEAGRHELVYKARDHSLQPGIYFIRMTADDGNQTHHKVTRVVYMN